jgi:phospholipid-translocating ATPase
VFEPSKFKSEVEVDSPTTKIYRFYGAIVHPVSERVPVGTENLLLRDCVLKNTDFVEGIVVYAGKIHGVSSTVVMYCSHLIIYAQFM